MDSIFETVLVWARLHGLPLEYWNEDVFMGIASSFGELLSIDPIIVARKRLVFARICVGVSQERDLPSSVKIHSKLGSWSQAIEFETIPFAYFNYRKSGHWAKHCPLKAKKEMENPNRNSKVVWKKEEKLAMVSVKKGADLSVNILGDAGFEGAAA